MTTLFRYFLASQTEMSDLVREPQPCTFCGQVAQCLRVESQSLQEACAEPTRFGCFECLRAGAFGFIHFTEAGFVDAGGLHLEQEDEPPPRRVFLGSADGTLSESPEPYLPPKKQPFEIRPEASQELFHTPNFATLQGWIPWLVHCHDFMQYLGTWEPSDFNQQAPDGQGRNLFLEMTGWEDADWVWPPQATFPNGWDFGYYAFQCRHCGKLRGTYDFT